jgi:anti-anti-sigma factor
MGDRAAEPLLEHYERSGAEVLVVRAAELYRADAIEQLGHELHRVMDASPAHRFIVDLGRVKFLTSGALGLIINTRAHLVKRGFTLALAGAAGEVARVLEHARLAEVMPVYATVEDALKKLTCDSGPKT